VLKLKFEITRESIKLILLSVAISVPIVVVNYILFRDDAMYFSSINIAAVLIFTLPIIIKKYLKYKRNKEVEEMFIIFLKDFVESVRGGMTIPNAMKSVTSNDYKSLTPYIKQMSAQMNWGIPAEKVFLKFSKGSESKLIGRIVSSVIESHRFGGNLASSFEALSKTSLEVERLRSERRLYLNSQMMTGYIIFFVFLAVIISLGRFLIPDLAKVSPGSMGGEAGPTVSVEEYKTIFMHLIVIQAFFAGLIVGKMSEGALIAGLKHSFFMVFAGIAAFVIAG
jgi:flagellar protein FlaJ